MSHQVALILCIVLGTFGGAVLLAFFMLFSNINIFGRGIDIARQRKKGFIWWYFLSDFAAGWQIWKETRGLRWLFVVGVFSCLASYTVYRVYLAWV